LLCLLSACGHEENYVKKGNLAEYVKRMEKEFEVRDYGIEGMLDEALCIACEEGDSNACVRQGLLIDVFTVRHTRAKLPWGLSNPFYERACNLGNVSACSIIPLTPKDRVAGKIVPHFLFE